MNSANTCAEIDLQALSHNFGVVKKKAGSSRILAVVKANAYGHGAVTISKHLLRCGAAQLGVAFIEEAVELRNAGIRAPILVFFENSDADSLITYSLTPVIYDLRNAKALAARARTYNRRIPVHIKVDTGMGRVGCTLKDAAQQIRDIAEIDALEIEGIMSHFSDADMTDTEFASHQLESFVGLIESLRRKNITFKLRHMANSAAVMHLPRAHLDMVRPGIMLYGYGPARKRELRPVMTMKSKTIFVKRVPPGTPVSYGRTFITKRSSIIATIPIGYADGYSRKLSNTGEVLINGRRAPIAGRVCMDTIMADVTEIPGLKETNEVILIGSQGSETITAQDLAEKTGSIPYEILSTVGNRVKRTYRH